MSQARSWLDSGRRWAWWPVLGLPVLMVVLRATLEPAVFYDPPWLILAGNTLFVSLVSFLVAAIAWRNYASTGWVQALLLGCAMLAFGLGGLLAALVRGRPTGANLNVTIYNTGALVSAALHAAAAVLLSGGLAPETGRGRRIGWLCLGYGASVLVMGLVALASLRGAVPVFFVQGSGPTPLRQQVLGAAILLFVMAWLVFLASYRRNGEPFLFWYSGALALTAISLAGFFIQPSVGSPVGWAGRISQYLGGIYFLVALLSAERYGRVPGATLDDALTESLAGAEERFRSAFANAAIGFALATPGRRLLTCNPAYCKLTGFSLEELRSLEGRSLVHPADREAESELNRRMLAGEIADYTLEHRVARKDGRLVWVRETLSLVRNPQGLPRWAVALVEDITARKNAEGAARENRSKLEVALSSMTDAVVITDTEGRFLNFNDAFATYHRFRNKEECYKSLAEYPDYIDAFLPDGTLAPLGQWAVPRALRGETVTNTEYRLRRKDTGETWWGSYSFGPVLDQDGRIAGSVVVGRDITERKRDEEALRIQGRQMQALLKELQRDEATLEAMFAAQLDVVLMFDDGMHVRRVNPVFGTLYGFDPVGLHLSELMARVGCRWMDGRPVEMDGALPTVRARGGDPARGFQFLVRQADGTEGCVETSSGPLLTPEGPAGVVTVWHDITERRRIEADLRAANQQKDEFLATLAHELRNPLAPIRTAAYLLKLGQSQDPQVRGLHDMIDRQAGHMARLVDDLLDVSRIERGKLALKTERMDFGAAVSRALEACRPQIEARRHQLEIDLPGAPFQVEADPARVDQMVCNLVHNACKYTPPGGRIQVSARPEGAQAVLRVRDNGVGMTPDALEHAFDLFYQVGQTLDRPEGGLGLGLTLVHRLALLHQGSVSAASEGLGQGSEFTLRLPVPESDGAVAEAPASPLQAVRRANAERQRRVMVVDDNRDVVLTTKALLESLGFQVSSAGSGEEGLRRILEQPPDLALVDLGLPGLDGFDVARRLRQRLGRNLHLVALSGYSRETDIAAAMAAGFDRHLVKSADPGDMLAALREYLD
jgi:PAS domain S-box-containing protein